MIEKAANTAIASGSGTAMFFGLTPSEWSIVGVIGGLLIGAAGLGVKTYFEWLRFKRGD